jgi:UDP-2,3-diacylglucosamine pyrophosphatase LpxH
MSSITLVMSDLHLTDGQSILEGFGDTQQAALEGLIAATTAGGPLGRADTVELVINGDGFDFLAISPYTPVGTSDIAIAMEKLNKIVAAHTPFFETLRRFIDTPGRRVTFITGNHDIELRFAKVQAGIYTAIGVASDDPRVFFCPTRFYCPLADVYIEHGNNYDFWNQSMLGLWDDSGQPLDMNPSLITLPVGSRYFQHAAYPISLNYAYFDHFEPSMNSPRQMALLCLLAPEMVVETAKHTLELLSPPRKALVNLVPGEKQIPVKLFEQAMMDFAAFHQDMREQKEGWVEPSGQDSDKVQADVMMEYLMLRQALVLPTIEAVAAICTPATYEMGESVAMGMHAVLQNEPQLRYAIAGHTHMVRIDLVNNGMQSYLNTGTWTTRLALPAPGEVNAALVEWLRQPDWQQIPLRDVSQLTFAMLNATSHEPCSGSLCVWEGGHKGSYRVIA